MAELRYEGSSFKGQQLHAQASGEAALSDGATGRPYSLATDWRHQAGPAQSGLPYRWSDGLPVKERWTQSQAVQLIVKRGIDLALASLALLFLLPLLLLVALAIKLTSPG